MFEFEGRRIQVERLSFSLCIFVCFFFFSFFFFLRNEDSRSVFWVVTG